LDWSSTLASASASTQSGRSAVRHDQRSFEMGGVAGDARAFEQAFFYDGIAYYIPVVAGGHGGGLAEAIDEVLAGDADMVGVAAVAVEDDDFAEAGLDQAYRDFADDVYKGVAG